MFLKSSLLPRILFEAYPPGPGFFSDQALYKGVFEVAHNSIAYNINNLSTPLPLSSIFFTIQRERFVRTFRANKKFDQC